MSVHRIALIGLSILGLTATITIALAQNTASPILNGNTSNPRLNGNTTNPRLSGNTVAQPPPVPVSPSPNLTILGSPLGRNSLTGLPCTGPGALAIPGPGTLPGTAAVPGATTLSQNGGTAITPPTSVFGSSPSCLSAAHPRNRHRRASARRCPSQASLSSSTDQGGGKRRVVTKTSPSTLGHSQEPSLHWRRVNIELVDIQQSGTNKAAHTKCASACAPPFEVGHSRWPVMSRV